MRYQFKDISVLFLHIRHWQTIDNMIECIYLNSLIQNPVQNMTKLQAIGMDDA